MELTFLFTFIGAIIATIGATGVVNKWVFIPIFAISSLLCLFPLLFMSVEFFTSPRSKYKRLKFAILKIYYGDTIDSVQNKLKIVDKAVYCNPFLNCSVFCNHEYLYNLTMGEKVEIPENLMESVVFTYDGLDTIMSYNLDNYINIFIDNNPDFDTTPENDLKNKEIGSKMYSQFKVKKSIMSLVNEISPVGPKKDLYLADINSRKNEFLSSLGIKIVFEQTKILSNGCLIEILFKEKLTVRLMNNQGEVMGHYETTDNIELRSLIRLINFIKMINDEKRFCCFLINEIQYNIKGKYCVNHCVHWNYFCYSILKMKKVYKQSTCCLNILEGYVSDSLIKDKEKISDDIINKIKWQFGDKNYSIFQSYFGQVEQKFLLDIFRKNLNCRDFYKNVIKERNWHWKRVFCDMSYFLEKMGTTALKGVDTKLNPKTTALQVFRSVKRMDNNIPNQSLKHFYDLVYSDKDDKKLKLNNSDYLLSKAVGKMNPINKSKPLKKTTISYLNNNIQQQILIDKTKYFTQGDNTKMSYKDKLMMKPVHPADDFGRKDIIKSFKKYIFNHVDNGAVIKDKTWLLESIAADKKEKGKEKGLSNSKGNKKSIYKLNRYDGFIKQVNKKVCKDLKKGVDSITLKNYYKKLDDDNPEPILFNNKQNIERAGDMFCSNNYLKKLTILETKVKTIILKKSLKLKGVVDSEVALDTFAHKTAEVPFEGKSPGKIEYKSDGEDKNLNDIGLKNKCKIDDEVDVDEDLETIKLKTKMPSLEFDYNGKKKIYKLEGRSYTLTKITNLIRSGWGESGYRFFVNSAKKAGFPTEIVLEKKKPEKVYKKYIDMMDYI